MLARVGKQCRYQGQNGSGQPKTTVEQKGRAIIVISYQLYGLHTSVQHDPRHMTERARFMLSPNIVKLMHIDVKFLFIRKWLFEDKLQYISSKLNLTDPFTKSLTKYSQIFH